MLVCYRYKRFLKGKDLSAASSEEMDCVLGRKRRKLSEPETKEKKVQLTTTAQLVMFKYDHFCFF